MKGFDVLREKYLSNSTHSVLTAPQRSLTLAQMDFSLDFTRPLMPHVLTVPYLFNREIKSPDNHELVQFIDDALEGFILVCLEYNSDRFNEETDLFLKVFSKLSQRVVWKTAQINKQNIPSNVMVLPWVSQFDLLGHENLKIFITSADTSSMFETVIHAKPVVVVPQFLDQKTNAARLTKKAKMGKTIKPEDLTFSNLFRAIQDVTTNNRYKRNAESARALLLDQIQDPKDTFLWWIRHMLQQNGATYLISDAAYKLNITQFLMIDILAVCLLVAVGVLLLVYIILKTTVRLLKTNKKSKKE